ncbi:activator of 90 kDa heat shock protein ATPase homolog 1-like [Pollicipes pollicipes]|uniref:activator of 90 kDa heat shock protein ATPase homolog 1-like n=1 Tax=Pollicipes pollicipes TaxID=41117 RepID=UPI00188549F7|nr:activator of 90 kDa heat shock protein ATPase homolog 1-like [Pollicipes pollicipes]XP_037072329.1 activator of 90 kDa heat shock protein ATPase homolog 1-like [Pollicipes pollicipes]XP_037072330.1 activator of 90 kDa heat shock protein ATPase homolog 1-like [Pollicipes pollicipes]XP_037072331.1 activator of 90 kDa heat shock protein ATPase homolog 1-like [Pollicipes pollicipes]XP_037072332.1 activator of 90 kDa heat shock protein ATPase homolog 1-like [Pollicipes pollicipes]
MAKWGEGDPRWIVEDRPDATNVNNWHWTEKNAAAWSKSKMESLLVGLVIDDDKVGRAEVTKIEKCDGDASVNNRKAKLIFFYEWDLKLEWKGKLNGSDTEHHGFVETPNLSDENDESDLDISASIKSTGPGAEIMKEMMRKKGADIIRKKLGEYVSALKSEFTAGMILPSNKEAGGGANDTKATVTKTQFNNSTNNLCKMEKLDIGAKIATATLTDTQQFKCTAEELYNAVTVKEMVEAFTNGPARLTAERGGEFSLLGGNISGTFEELTPGRRLVQQWRLKSWPGGHLSTVTIEFEQKDDCTELRLSQTAVPASELERTRQGWQRYYWDAMRRTFGFGAALL